MDKFLTNLGLDPGEYELILTDKIPAKGNNNLGTVCIFDKKVWVKTGLSDLKTVFILLHEIRHLHQMEKLGWHLPGDKEKMEKDANKWAEKNISKYYCISVNGQELTGIKAIRFALKNYKNL